MNCIHRCRCRRPSCRAPRARADASAIAGSTPAVEEAVERPRDALTQTVEQCAAPPAMAVELQRLTAVCREDRRGLAGQRGALDFLVGLEIPAEAPAIEVARANAQPVIAQHHLPVQDPGLILEDAHA